MKVKIIGLKYNMLKQIGSGISSVVYLAEHKMLHHKCVIKCISKAKDNSSIFLREAEFLKNLNNLYAPILYDYEEDNNYWYLIEEYIDGQSLYNLGKSHGMISQSRLMEIAIKICEVIKWLHERKPYPVLYLDLKPEHIIFTGKGIKLLDFGSAVYLKGEKISGNVMGTVGFASPEQVRGEKIDQRSDIYSIGAVLYWLMTGDTAEGGESLNKVLGYTGKWNAIIRKCLAYEVEERYSSVKDLIKDIQDVKQREEKRQLSKSVRIAVTGSQNRVGTTHFAIGMSISCRKQGIQCLYEEKNDSGAIQEIFNNSRRVNEKNGIYYLPGFIAIPRYGQAVYEDLVDSSMLISDYGRFQDEKVAEYGQADCIIVVAGGKEWEIQQTKDLIERYRKRKNIFYVLRSGSTADFQRWKKELVVHNIFKMPEYEHPFSIGKQEQKFYKMLLDHIMVEIARSRKCSEEKQNKIYNYNRFNRGR